MLVLAEHVAQGAALDVLHDDVRHRYPVVDVLAGVVDRDDRGMVECRGRLGLPAEPGLDRLVAGEVGPQHLDRHGAAEASVGAEADLGHPAPTEDVAEVVPSAEQSLVDALGVAGGVTVGPVARRHPGRRIVEAHWSPTDRPTTSAAAARPVQERARHELRGHRPARIPMEDHLEQFGVTGHGAPWCERSATRCCRTLGIPPVSLGQDDPELRPSPGLGRTGRTPTPGANHHIRAQDPHDLGRRSRRALHAASPAPIRAAPGHEGLPPRPDWKAPHHAGRGP